ncbi:uncharacterized protein BXIN_0521 [Babesia sp. Xinjiang]|uniref:uncharacterized protein n=1 Tax=Babesia sp. Xinjiang TaxID=462227 RepID=UPI000A218E3F|nr:uncharacterized protein BXIN_0521 [Babesia sp. Xinjiang]ORM41900.1 hypothetical protein BXIN_0521 [Babesia sp. Xinjiang]
MSSILLMCTAVTPVLAENLRKLSSEDEWLTEFDSGPNWYENLTCLQKTSMILGAFIVTSFVISLIAYGVSAGKKCDLSKQCNRETDETDLCKHCKLCKNGEDGDDCWGCKGILDDQWRKCRSEAKLYGSNNRNGVEGTPWDKEGKCAGCLNLKKVPPCMGFARHATVTFGSLTIVALLAFGYYVANKWENIGTKKGVILIVCIILGSIGIGALLSHIANKACDLHERVGGDGIYNVGSGGRMYAWLIIVSLIFVLLGFLIVYYTNRYKLVDKAVAALKDISDTDPYMPMECRRP